MDGVETTLKLRAMGYDHPIVALTANAFSDMADIFMANGFSGYATKPINVNQLDKYLMRFIHDKQSQEVLDKARDAKLRATDEEYDENLSDMLVLSFQRDAKKAIDILGSLYPSRSPNDLNSYIIQVHAMKSALYNIGRMQLSDEASKLEQAGRKNDLKTIADDTPSFIEHLTEVVKQLERDDVSLVHQDEEDILFLQEQMRIIYDACESFEINEAKKAVKELFNKNYSKEIKEILHDISEHLLSSDFDEAGALAKQVADGNLAKGV